MSNVNKIMIGLFLIGTAYYVITKYEASLIESVFAAVKAAGYAILAFYIFKITKDAGQIDVLTFFTYILACFEATHNLCNSLGKWIAAVIKLLVKRD